MKTQKLYNERLLKYAQALEATTSRNPEHGLIGKVNIADIANNIHFHFHLLYQEFLFEILPEIFSEWGFNGKFGNPLPQGEDENESTVAAVINFFDLNSDELCFLFDVEGFQLEQFGGEVLNFESDESAYARNIRALIKYREERVSENLTRS